MILFSPKDKDVIKELKLIRPGIYPTIITIDGFLSDSDVIDNEWQEAINHFYPNNEWVHLKWKSKSVKDLITNFSFHLGIRTIISVTLPYTIILHPISIAQNTWYKALRNSRVAGNDLADILIKNKSQEFILMGHSLGGNVIYNCLKELSNRNMTIINEVHILGGAVNNSNENWSTVKKSVKHNIFNYFSKKDKILKFAYSISTNDRFPIGRNKIDIKEIINLDVSNKVKGHMDFKKEYKNLIKSSIDYYNSN
jgi:predicted alpha/beta hydrolase family esterase